MDVVILFLLQAMNDICVDSGIVNSNLAETYRDQGKQQSVIDWFSPIK